ncbi:hypothetical protein B0H13DRAFT_898701 [Mycena leptocephala]|nr:hypothetical protein B0H13DRAFT_898701 [Mycena leptocephala]
MVMTPLIKRAAIQGPAHPASLQSSTSSLSAGRTRRRCAPSGPSLRMHPSSPASSVDRDVPYSWLGRASRHLDTRPTAICLDACISTIYYCSQTRRGNTIRSALRIRIPHPHRPPRAPRASLRDHFMRRGGSRVHARIPDGVENTPCALHSAFPHPSLRLAPAFRVLLYSTFALPIFALDHPSSHYSLRLTWDIHDPNTWQGPREIYGRAVYAHAFADYVFLFTVSISRRRAPSPHGNDASSLLSVSGAAPRPRRRQRLGLRNFHPVASHPAAQPGMVAPRLSPIPPCSRISHLACSFTGLSGRTCNFQGRGGILGLGQTREGLGLGRTRPSSSCASPTLVSLLLLASISRWASGGRRVSGQHSVHLPHPGHAPGARPRRLACVRVRDLVSQPVCATRSRSALEARRLQVVVQWHPSPSPGTTAASTPASYSIPPPPPPPCPRPRARGCSSGSQSEFESGAVQCGKLRPTPPPASATAPAAYDDPTRTRVLCLGPLLLYPLSPVVAGDGAVPRLCPARSLSSLSYLPLPSPRALVHLDRPEPSDYVVHARILDPTSRTRDLGLLWLSSPLSPLSPATTGPCVALPSESLPPSMVSPRPRPPSSYARAPVPPEPRRATTYTYPYL